MSCTRVVNCGTRSSMGLAPLQWFSAGRVPNATRALGEAGPLALQDQSRRQCHIVSHSLFLWSAHDSLGSTDYIHFGPFVLQAHIMCIYIYIYMYTYIYTYICMYCLFMLQGSPPNVTVLRWVFTMKTLDALQSAKSVHVGCRLRFALQILQALHYQLCLLLAHMPVLDELWAATLKLQADTGRDETAWKRSNLDWCLNATLYIYSYLHSFLSHSV